MGDQSDPKATSNSPKIDLSVIVLKGFFYNTETVVPDKEFSMFSLHLLVPSRLFFDNFDEEVNVDSHAHEHNSRS